MIFAQQRKRRRFIGHDQTQLAIRSDSSLAFDLETGERGSRHAHIEPLVKKLTGAESAVVVNNNAAAVFLALNTLAFGKEVIVSRGQQVEIGGSFRIPDIIAQSGGKMIEVGTTNKTRLQDYEKAVSEDTAVLLRVHTSNFKVTGFTEEVSLSGLVQLAENTGVKAAGGLKPVVMEDLGSGSLFDLSVLGICKEPTVQDSIRDGADIVTFSGDKLLGGPQAGIIAGKKHLIDRIKKNPLARAVRSDKTTIAALAAVLTLYLDMDAAAENIPVLKMLSLKPDDLAVMAKELVEAIHSQCGGQIKTEILDVEDEAGGGSLPGVCLAGKAVALEIQGISAGSIQEKLRKSKIPVIARIYRDRILLNVRTLQKEDHGIIAGVLEEMVRLHEDKPAF